MWIEGLEGLYSVHDGKVFSHKFGRFLKTYNGTVKIKGRCYYVGM